MHEQKEWERKEWEKEKKEINEELNRSIGNEHQLTIELRAAKDDEKRTACKNLQEAAQHELFMRNAEANNEKMVTNAILMHAKMEKEKAELHDKANQLTEQLQRTTQKMECEREQWKKDKTELQFKVIENGELRLHLQESYGNNAASRAKMEEIARSTLAAIKGERPKPKTAITIDEVDFVMWPMSTCGHNNYRPYFAIPEKVMKSLFGIESTYNIYYVRFNPGYSNQPSFSAENLNHDFGANITDVMNALRAAKK
jgi:hypothetical protein